MPRSSAPSCPRACRSADRWGRATPVARHGLPDRAHPARFMIMSAQDARGPHEYEKDAPLEWRAPSLEAERGQVGRAAVEVGRVLEGLAQPQHVALAVGLADDLDAERQSAGEAAGHRKRAEAEIVARPRQVARDG